MKEELISYFWKFQLFNEQLVTTSGEPIEVIKPGEPNIHSGADFANARIKIGDTLWAGSVEIHSHSSHWNLHNHHTDKSYNNVVLHVVMHDDKEVKNEAGNLIPTVVLDGKLNTRILHNYEKLISGGSGVLCKNDLHKVDLIKWSSWTERLVIERLERKAAEIERILFFNQGNWEETFYQAVARSFGFKVNADPFLLLAQSISNYTLSKHRSSLQQVESLMFGQAGFLADEQPDNYFTALQNEYNYLKHKLNLQPLEKHLWKFLRMRPVNFPSVRIAQFSALIYQSDHLFSKITAADKINQLYELFDVTASTYWTDHYIAGKVSDVCEKHFGKSSAELIIINTIIPLLFVYGKQTGNEAFSERALAFLNELKAESNSVVKEFKSYGVEVKSAFNSQGILQLYNEYCSKTRCLNCGIGNDLLRKSSLQQV